MRKCLSVANSLSRTPNLLTLHDRKIYFGERIIFCGESKIYCGERNISRGERKIYCGDFRRRTAVTQSSHICETVFALR